jgi:hypothetical protein
MAVNMLLEKNNSKIRVELIFRVEISSVDFIAALIRFHQLIMNKIIMAGVIFSHNDFVCSIDKVPSVDSQPNV